MPWRGWKLEPQGVSVFENRRLKLGGGWVFNGGEEEGELTGPLYVVRALAASGIVSFLSSTHRHTSTSSSSRKERRRRNSLSLSLYSIHLSRAQHTGSRLLYNMHVFKWCRRQAASVQLLFTVRTGLCFFHSSSRNASGVFFYIFTTGRTPFDIVPFLIWPKKRRKTPRGVVSWV